MVQIPTTELRRRMREAIDEVRAGARIIVTHNGRPVAELVPYRGAARKPKGGRALLEEFRAAGPLARITDREIGALRDRSRERRRD